MNSIHVGDLIRTNYGTGPFIVCSIVHFACTCPEYSDECEYGDEAPRSRPHLHLKVRRPDDVKCSWLNGYDPKTLKSVWNEDELIVISRAAQTELAFGVPS
jgi:hypothetical protein